MIKVMVLRAREAYVLMHSDSKQEIQQVWREIVERAKHRYGEKFLQKVKRVQPVLWQIKLRKRDLIGGILIIAEVTG